MTKIRNIPSRLRFVISTSILTACATTDKAMPRASTQDSAGIAIVVNEVLPDSASVGTRPALHIGNVTGDPLYEFHEIGPLAVNGSGEIFVADGGSLSIRVYNQDGKFLRQFGRSGQGPGEFRSLTSIVLAGDSVVVFDKTARRVTLFTTAGNTVETWDLRVANRGRIEPMVMVRNQLVSVVRAPSRHFTADVMTVIQDSAEIATFDLATRTLGRGVRSWNGERRIAGLEVYPVTPLFEPKVSLAVRDDGFQYHASGGRYVIDMFDPDGRHVRRIRREIEPTPIKTEHIETLVATARGGELRTALERSARFPPPPHFAIIGAILVSDDGSLLVQRIDELDPIQLERSTGYGSRDRADAASAMSAVRWERFNREGRYVGAVRLQRRFYPRVYDGVSVLGVLEDSDGVQTVARFPLGQPQK